MPTVSLSAAEILVLRRAAHAVLDEGGPGARGAERALATLSHRVEAAAPPLAEPRDRRALREASGDEGHIAALAGAIAERHRVTFRYRTGETPADQTRRIEPAALGYRNGGWYLAGHDIDRRDLRVMRVGRIAGEVKWARGATRQPVDADPELLFRAAPFSFGPLHGPAAEVRLLLDGDTARRVVPLLPSHVAVRHQEDGGAVLRLYVHDAGAFFDWIIPLGPGAEVLEPDEMRAQLAVRVETTAIAWSRA